MLRYALTGARLGICAILVITRLSLSVALAAESGVVPQQSPAIEPGQVPSDELEFLPTGGAQPLGEKSTLGGPALPDLDVAYIGRTPRFSWNQAPGWPAPGQIVTFEGHIANRGAAPTGSFGFAWSLDGVPQSTATWPGLAPGQETLLTWEWTWDAGPHTIRLALDPSGQVAEVSEQNNSVTDRSNALALGIWVEQSFYDFFNQNVWQSGWGGNSFDDWLQRHVTIWNDMLASAQYPLIAPTGMLDRIRLDKVIRVPDGGLNCQTNLPAVDYEVDLIWGFPSEQVGVASPANCTWWTPRYRDDPATWDRDLGLIHELNHARYHIDLYGFNLDAHEVTLAAPLGLGDTTLTVVNLPAIPEFQPPADVIVEGEIIQCQARSGNSLMNCARGAQGTTVRTHAAGVTVYGDQIRLQDGEGNALVGSAGLPVLNGAFHRGADFGFDIMNAGSHYGEYSAYVWNRIAGRRPVCGNSNAPCNLGEFLQERPASNVLELREANGDPIPHAWVEVYRAKPYPIWYGKAYEGPPDLILVTDAQGHAELGAAPFGAGGVIHTYGHSNGVLALVIKVDNRVGVQFLEVTEFNLAYGRGQHQVGLYPVVLSTWATLAHAVQVKQLYLPLVER